jgi:hypothetical protein
LLEACARWAGERAIRVSRVRGDQVVAGSSFAAVRELLWGEVRSSGVLNGFALAGQESADTFLATDGTTTLDPDTVLDPQCPSPFFETPFTGALP